MAVEIPQRIQSRPVPSLGRKPVARNYVDFPYISRLTSDDLAQVLEIERCSYDAPWSETLFLAEFRKDYAFQFGLFRRGELAAQIFCHLVAGELHVLNVAVHPKHRRCGYAGKLIRHCLEEAGMRAASVAYLEVRVSNAAARDLYFKLGFSASGIRKNYYHNNGEDALLLTKTLGTR